VAQQSLFRPQAVAAATGEQSSVSLPVAPLSWHVLGGFLVACLAVVVIFLGTAEYARKEMAIGALLAPVEGRTAALQVTPGLRVDPSKPRLPPVPVDPALRAELILPSRAIAFVEPGQRVRLMVDAFPYRRFGTLGGTVETVSKAVLSPEAVIGNVALTGAASRVTIRLDRRDIDAFERFAPLEPAMTLRAHIVLESRSLMAWLLEPLIGIRGRR
jgi:membrane fusion protein